MGPLRASAGLLVTFGHKSNMRSIIMLWAVKVTSKGQKAQTYAIG
jgi:hypothetical protein